MASRLALEPGWTAYCIDVERRQMLFVEIPPEADLCDAGEAARRALVVPFAALEDLAGVGPVPRQIVFVFNIARCGSTLVNAMLNGVEGVWSVSEPVPLFDLVMRRHLLDPGEISRLVRACVPLSFRPPPTRRAHQGLPFLAVRYNELQADREATTARLLRHCGLPASAGAAAASAFERDSQAGTVIARDRRDATPFSEAEALAFRVALAREPRVTSPDMILRDVYS